MTTTPLPRKPTGKLAFAYQTIATLEQARADLEAENQRLRVLLAEAADDIESWGAYAPDYFQKKHDLSGCVTKYRAALESKP